MRLPQRLPISCLLAFLCGGCLGVIKDSDSTPAAPGARSEAPSAALAPRGGLRRLTVAEYESTMRDLLGTDSGGEARKALGEATRNPFDNDFLLQEPSTGFTAGLDILAQEAVRRVSMNAAARNRVVGCVPSGPGDQDCFRRFVTTFGRRVLRRPLSADEIARFTALQGLAVETGDFNVAVDAALGAFLLHPELIYRVEVGSPSHLPGVSKLGPWEVGARLSFLLWGSTPDDVLLDAAGSGQLSTAEGVRRQASRMLADARALALVTRFHAMWLDFEDTSGLGSLGPAMASESAALIRRVIFAEDRSWLELFRWPETYVTTALARHYGLPGASGTGPAWAHYGDTGRRGLLSHGAFLATGAKYDTEKMVEDTSPTVRGLAVLTRLLCEEIGRPPPDVDPDQSPPASAGAACKEDRYRLNSAAPRCAACHNRMDPLGFGLERFDQRGALRTRENGRPECPIPGIGELRSGGGTVRFSGVADLSSALLSSGELGRCAVSQLYRFATGRTDLDDVDQELVDVVSRNAGGPEPRFRDLVLDLVSSDAFRHRRDGSQGGGM